MKNSFEFIGNAYKVIRIHCNCLYIDNVKHERNAFYEVLLFVEDVVLSVDGVILKEMHFT